jgi:hypothetical protein
MSIQTQKDIEKVSKQVSDLLISKNKSYGDSALHPTRVFSKADNVEQLLVRIDDKLSRIQNGHAWPGDNDIDDLIGYLILLKIAKERASVEKA